MKIKSQKDFWAGIMFTVIGGAFAFGSTSYAFGSSARPGPGYFPFGLGVLMALLGLVILFRSLAIETESGDRIGKWAWRPLFFVAGAVVVFGWLLPRVGMVIALPILIGMSAWAGSEFRWRDVILNSVVLTTASWAAFVWGLGLSIPVWPAFWR